MVHLLRVWIPWGDVSVAPIKYKALFEQKLISVLKSVSRIIYLIAVSCMNFSSVTFRAHDYTINMHLIGFQLCVAKREWKLVLKRLRCYISPETQSSTRCKATVHCSRSRSSSTFVPILTHGHESWVMTERVLAHIQETEVRFLRGVHGVTRRDKVRSYEIHRTLNVEPLRIERSQYGHVTRVTKDELARQVLLATSTGIRPRDRPNQVAWLHLRPCLVSSACAARITICDCWRTWGLRC